MFPAFVIAGFVLCGCKTHSHDQVLVRDSVSVSGRVTDSVAMMEVLRELTAVEADSVIVVFPEATLRAHGLKSMRKRVLVMSVAGSRENTVDSVRAVSVVEEKCVERQPAVAQVFSEGKSAVTRVGVLFIIILILTLMVIYLWKK